MKRLNKLIYFIKKIKINPLKFEITSHISWFHLQSSKSGIYLINESNNPFLTVMLKDMREGSYGIKMNLHTAADYLLKHYAFNK